MDPADLDGRDYPPGPLTATPERVAAFVAATGDAPDRWTTHAPPCFASAGLFVVAPALLADAAGLSIVHSDQVFRWHRGLEVGETVEVAGRVAGVRSRGSLSFVTFEASMGDWAESVSTFLLAEGSASSGNVVEESEPDVLERSSSDTAGDAGPLTDDVPPLRKSASRADLVAYAAASGDLNPIHWDHASAVAAGLPGVIAHGLLMAAWAAQAVTRHTPGEHPLSELTLRFRNALRPARAVEVHATPEGTGAKIEITADGDRLVTGSARVTA